MLYSFEMMKFQGIGVGGRRGGGGGRGGEGALFRERGGFFAAFLLCLFVMGFGTSEDSETMPKKKRYKRKMKSFIR